MPSSSFLAVSLALERSLQNDLAGLLVEVNAAQLPDRPIYLPASIELGISTDMLQRKLPHDITFPTDSELPAISISVHNRVAHYSGEEEFSQVIYGCVVDIYCGDKVKRDLYIKTTKWAMVMDLWVERFCSRLVHGLFAEEAPDIEITYTLTEPRDKTFRQLVTVVFTLMGPE